jgi:hypothetical protein
MLASIENGCSSGALASLLRGREWLQYEVLRGRPDHVKREDSVRSTHPDAMPTFGLMNAK